MSHEMMQFLVSIGKWIGGAAFFGLLSVVVPTVISSATKTPNNPIAPAEDTINFTLIGTPFASSTPFHAYSTQHNVTHDNKVGMQMNIAFGNLTGRDLQIVTFFYTSTYAPLRDFNGRYSSSDGSVAVTMEYKAQASSSYVPIAVFMPYSELHLDCSIGGVQYQLAYRTYIFILGTNTILNQSDWQQMSLNCPST